MNDTSNTTNTSIKWLSKINIEKYFEKSVKLAYAILGNKWTYGKGVGVKIRRQRNTHFKSSGQYVKSR